MKSYPMWEHGAIWSNLVAERARRAHWITDAACLAAIAGGKHGVLVTHYAYTTTAQVHPDVPYGYVYERWAQ